ncbi:MAG TPA: hypothetical protein VGH33_21180 [Isosphaeraceae bacterium]|jgi:protein-tyrosine-phosphatase
MRPLLIGLALAALGPASPPKEPGPFVSALWLFQRHGTPRAVDLGQDVHVKAVLARSLKDSTITASEVEGLMDPSTFARLAGADGKLDAEDIRRAVEADVPPSRERLNPAVRAHADGLTTSFDMIGDAHREAGAKLADWIAANYRPGRPLDVVVVCTGNSRRSILGATMGNIAAGYYGMPEVRFHSGGTAPTAFNARTIAALEAIGVEVKPAGKEAPRGEPKTANAVYTVRWGAAGEPAMEAVEFSKMYSDAANPHSGFAALMVCSEADAGCPFVKGATLRVSMPYLDPKVYDGSPFEAAKYAERRDDIGRLMLSAFLGARTRFGVPAP